MTHSAPALLNEAAKRCGCGDEALRRFSQTLQSLPLFEAARINPFTFADRAEIDAETTLDLFVHGAKLGLFDLEWGAVCPLCGAIASSVADLGQVAEDLVHCALCDCDAPSVLDDTVEVTFAYSPKGTVLDLHKDFAAYQHYYTSSGYPYREQWRSYYERHTLADVKLRPGEDAKLVFSIEAGGTYRVLCLDTHSGATLLGAEEGSGAEEKSEAELALSEQGFSHRKTTLSAGEASLALANRTEQAVWIRVLKIVMDDILEIQKRGPAVFGPRVTGKHLLNNQAFRDCFALNELATDLKLKLRSLTLLFTDLKGSTALYDQEGDLAAYRLVQDHFVALKQVVRKHSGAVIKTMGDAVMAAFPNGNDGIAAAIEMMTAMQELNGHSQHQKVGLKIGLHAGPALAINAGASLDYFGQTVNIAARVQGLADAGEICVTGAINSVPEATARLAAAGYNGEAELARLKGVSATEEIMRYRGAA